MGKPSPYGVIFRDVEGKRSAGMVLPKAKSRARSVRLTVASVMERSSLNGFMRSIKTRACPASVMVPPT